MSSLLIPELPDALVYLIVEYFDNFFDGGPACSSWHSTLDYDDFHKLVQPHLGVCADDGALFVDCTHKNMVYDILLGNDAVNGVLAHLYRAGMSFTPTTIHCIALAGGSFADWVADNFFLQLETPIERLINNNEFNDNDFLFFQKVRNNITHHRYQMHNHPFRSFSF